MVIIINRQVYEIQRNGGGNNFKMLKKVTFNKISKRFTMNMEIMDEASISGREKFNCLIVERGGFNPLKKDSSSKTVVHEM